MQIIKIIAFNYYLLILPSTKKQTNKHKSPTEEDRRGLRWGMQSSNMGQAGPGQRRATIDQDKPEGGGDPGGAEESTGLGDIESPGDQGGAMKTSSQGEARALR